MSDYREEYNARQRKILTDAASEKGAVRFTWHHDLDESVDGVRPDQRYPAEYLDAARTRWATPALAVEGGGYPGEHLEGVPLHVGQEVVTLCEVIQHVRFNRLITIRLEDIRPGSWEIADTELLHWYMQRNGQRLPTWFPTGGTMAEVVRELVVNPAPVAMFHSRNKLSLGWPLGQDGATVALRLITLAGGYDETKDHPIDSIFRLDVGGMFETCLFDYADAHPD